MMGLVRLALRRPYTAAIASLLILLMGGLAVTRMIVDIFPIIDIPVVLVAWNYPGLSAEDMERRVVLVSERSYSQTINGISHMESQSIPSTGIIKIYFEPGTDVGGAIAQISAANNTILRIVPPGMTPPNIIQFNAASVPVIQLTATSKAVPEQNIFDYALNFLRLKLFTISGLSVTAPYGGKSRQIVVSLDPPRLAAKGVSPNDVVQALQASNVIVPAGVARIGSREYNVALNSSPPSVDQFNQLPLGMRNGVPVTLGDVAHVADSFATQTQIAHVNGERAIFLLVLRHSDASTLAVINATRDLMPEIQAAAPEGIELKLDFDQSVFVRAAINNVVREAIVSSILVSLMILLFLGSWRNTAVVALSIPLSIFAAIAGLLLTGQSVNLMTLGGLSLAIGLLVDNATVTIENIHRNQSLGKPLMVAILDGASEVVQPMTVATLAICIVFFPVVLLTGPARFLFIPLAITVVLAMLASYVLSFSVVPSFARFMLAGEARQAGHGHDGHQHAPPLRPRGVFARFGDAFQNGFEHFRLGYGRALQGALAHRGFVLVCGVILLGLTGWLATTVGTDFFPTADVGIIKLHYRAPIGTRLEETERLILQVDDKIRHIIPADELGTINDVTGVPFSYNLAIVPSDNVSSADAEITIQLRGEHRPSADYIHQIRAELPKAFPGSQFYFQNGDIVSQVLNFGLSAPIDVQIQAQNFEQAQGLARQVLQAMQKIPGVADPHIVQILNYPSLQVNVDRLKAAELGLSQRDVSNNMLIALSTSQLVAPSQFLNPVNNVNYSVVVAVPLERMQSVDDLMSTAIAQPVSTPVPTTQSALAVMPNAPVTSLQDVATVAPSSTYESLNHYTVQRIIDVAANVDGRDLGGTGSDIQAAIDQIMKGQPITTHIDIRGQNEVMKTSFRNLALGLILAIILVYALLVVLFQSWVDPFIIMMALSGALIGILWMLVLTHTTINVESLMGTIMSVGISVSNSILVVSFANDIRARDNLDPFTAVIEAAKTRLRPILMTALAMIIGMIPMALGLGEAGEQNAPLGRAVIGGLAAATLATLFIVPIIYTLLRKKPPSLYELDQRFAAEAAGAVGSTGEGPGPHG
jgi:multidrug efflux pump subunit AcrB